MSYTHHSLYLMHSLLRQASKSLERIEAHGGAFYELLWGIDGLTFMFHHGGRERRWTLRDGFAVSDAVDALESLANNLEEEHVGN